MAGNLGCPIPGTLSTVQFAEKNELHFHLATPITKKSRETLELGHQHRGAQCHHTLTKILARKTKVRFGRSNQTMGTLSLGHAQCIAHHAVIHLTGSCFVSRCIQRGIKDSTNFSPTAEWFSNPCLSECSFKFNTDLEFIS